MLPYFNKSSCHHLAIRLSAASLAFLLLLPCAAVHVGAQGGFSSGSTGADGPFNPTTSQSVQIPPSGVFNFTTFNIPAGFSITFIPNANNTPLVILATGDVTITGAIFINGSNSGGFTGGIGGPGGKRGGNGGLTLAGLTQGQSGDGPGGGLGSGSGGNSHGGGGGYATAGVNGAGPAAGQGGQAYGNLSILPLLGGSGGGGSGSTGVGGTSGNGGGGGGGAILIASSGNIIFTASGGIVANGGNGGCCLDGRGGGGSGGAIRLMANTISGSGFLQVLGGVFGGTSTRSGAPGFIRVEAFNSSGYSPGLSSGAVISSTLPGAVMLPSTAPSLRIASVAGIATPSSPLGSFQGQPDIVVPSAQANPVPIALEASNLPLGSVVDVTLTPERGAPATVQSSPLAGTEANSTASASISLSNMISVISAKLVINLNPLKPNSIGQRIPTIINGERITRIEISAVYGGASQTTYITESGRRVPAQP
jgi:hypothetical protein